MLSERKVRTAPCIAGCGRQVPYKTNAKVVCDACFSERKRAKDRRAAEKRRRKNGVAAVGDTQIQCARCERLISRRGIKRKFCDECAPKAVLERASAYQEARRRRIGLTELGTKQKCANCPEIFSKDSPKQIYCLECMVLQKANKLPSLKDWMRVYWLEVRKPEYHSNPVVKERIRKNAAENRRQRKAKNPGLSINERMSAAIRFSLNGSKNGSSWESLVGYSLADLMRHLERQFLPGMSWDNRHLWQIDHRQPLASFSFATAEDPEFLAAWAITNLSPLWAKDNLEKRAQRLHLL